MTFFVCLYKHNSPRLPPVISTRQQLQNKPEFVDLTCRISYCFVAQTEKERHRSRTFFLTTAPPELRPAKPQSSPTITAAPLFNLISNHISFTQDLSFYTKHPPTKWPTLLSLLRSSRTRECFVFRPAASDTRHPCVCHCFSTQCSRPPPQTRGLDSLYSAIG